MFEKIINLTEAEIRQTFINDYNSFMRDTRVHSSPSWQTPRGHTFMGAVDRVYELDPGLALKQIKGARNRIKTGRAQWSKSGDINQARFERRYLEIDARGFLYNLSIVEKNQNNRYIIDTLGPKVVLTSLGKKLLRIHGTYGCRARGRELFKKDKQMDSSFNKSNKPSKVKISVVSKKQTTITEALTEALQVIHEPSF